MLSKVPWYTVYGAFTPSDKQFTTEEEAVEYARSKVNDWAKRVWIVKSEVIHEFTLEDVYPTPLPGTDPGSHQNPETD
jgi:hypothetical protein